MIANPQKARAPRRKRADSTDAAVRDVQAAAMVIEPHADMKLTNRQREIFGEVINEVPKSEWTLHAVRVAAVMAREMDTVETQQMLLIEEGHVITAVNGNPVKNPRAGLIADLMRSILATRRSLSLTARAKAGNDNRTLGQRRAIQLGNECLLDIDDDEGLFNRPSPTFLQPRR